MKGRTLLLAVLGSVALAWGVGLAVADRPLGEAESGRRWRRAPAGAFLARARARLAERRYLEAVVDLEVAAMRGGPDTLAERDFLQGNVAFARFRELDALTRRVEAGVPAFDAADAALGAAIGSWLEALERREVWPAARRNLERAVVARDDLHSRRKKLARQTRGTRTERARDPESGGDDRRDSRRRREGAGPRSTGGRDGRVASELRRLVDEERLRKRAARVRRRVREIERSIGR